ncbi:Ulp1 protease family protein, partial [Striga asiatica]
MFQERHLEIEETDEDDAPESPKGRGHRKKRKAAILLTPWRNPGKRQKISNVTEYDPHRTLDEAKLEDLRQWLANSPESDEIDVAWGKGSAGKNFFNDLLDDKWLCSEHVDATLFHMRCRAIEYPLLFRQDCVMLDPHFVSYIRIRVKVESFDRTNFPKALVKYAEGKLPTHARPWTSCTKLYVPFCNVNNEHWVALDIDLSKRCIDAYDSSTSVMRKRQFETELEPIRVVIPMLMRMLNATYSAEKFDLKRLPCPSQANGYFDCGMFTIKFIEFLHAGKDVKGVEQKMIPSWQDDVCRNGFWQLGLTRRQPCRNKSCRKEGVSSPVGNKWCCRRRLEMKGTIFSSGALVLKNEECGERTGGGVYL